MHADDDEHSENHPRLLVACVPKWSPSAVGHLFRDYLVMALLEEMWLVLNAQRRREIRTNDDDA